MNPKENEVKSEETNTQEVKEEMAIDVDLMADDENDEDWSPASMKSGGKIAESRHRRRRSGSRSRRGGRSRSGGRRRRRSGGRRKGGRRRRRRSQKSGEEE
ncbi:female-specific protein transformer-like [Oppia nitens]|uniref:female-specific protein transformer-like n=1 Tax=Oppia nitens TaxID=1686743 RepID=UPI0023DC9FB6|nr:female-specific protein transformer-like [Oppia nitens]XP_054162391.1 female-specific protein transformer-like [Oppia nitens]